MVLVHTYECSYCRSMKSNKEEIKYCGGCKVMGYCSEEKADWKEHKYICKGTFTGKPAVSRNPVIKIAERIAQDEGIMAQIDCILITVLDLIYHPENAKAHGVALAAHVEYTDMEMARSTIEALLAGREPAPLPERIPKLLQISKAVRIDPDAIPEGLEKGTAMRMKKLQEHGYLGQQAPGDDLVIRAMWVESEVSLDSYATMYFYRVIPRELIEEVAKWKGDTGEPVTTKDLVGEFNRLAYADIVRRRQMSTMVPSNADQLLTLPIHFI